MTYTVDMTQPSTINFAPASVAEEVAQNIRTILSTPLGTVPLARDIGISISAVDEPGAIAAARLTSEIFTAIAEQEPRAIVIEVSFPGDVEDAKSGRIPPVVRYSLASEVGGSAIE